MTVFVVVTLGAACSTLSHFALRRVELVAEFIRF
jgi:hypothetical protein